MQDRTPGAARVFWSLLFCSRAVTKQKLNLRAGLLTREATQQCLPSRVCVGFSFGKDPDKDKTKVLAEKLFWVVWSS